MGHDGAKTWPACVPRAHDCRAPAAVAEMTMVAAAGAEFVIVASDASDATGGAYSSAQIATRGVTLANLLNVALGSGVLGMARAYAMGGWAWTTCFVVLFACLGAFANAVVVRACVRHRVTSIQGLISATQGDSAARIVMAAMVVYSFGGAAANLVMVGDFMSPACEQLAGQWFAEGHAAPPWLCGRQLWISLVATSVILPLSLRYAALPPPAALVGRFKLH